MEFSLEGFSFAHIEDHYSLHERRIFLGMTQQKVADRAGIPLQSYQQFESGKRKIRRASFDIACRVLKALDMDIAGFFNGDYSVGEPTYFKDGRHYFKATDKPCDEEPSDEE